MAEFDHLAALYDQMRGGEQRGDDYANEHRVEGAGQRRRPGPAGGAESVLSVARSLLFALLRPIRGRFARTCRAY
jgi:hypothetical protein